MDFPAQCIRGLRVQQWIRQDGKLRTDAYRPNRSEKAQRPDGLFAASINWDDDANAVPFTLTQPSAQFGHATVRRSNLDEIREDPGAKGVLQYERDELPDNRYHGNILFDKDTPKPVETFIAGKLAQLSKVFQRSSIAI